jgi:PAS domain S-box-containing protein
MRHNPLIRIGLIKRIALLVVMIEITAFSTLGWFYIDRFSISAEDQLRSRLVLAGQMITGNTLPVSAAANPALIGDLVGAPCLDGVVVGGSGRVIVSTNPDNLGRPAADIPGFDRLWLDASTPDEQIITRDGALIGLSCSRGASRGPATYCSVITISTRELQAQKDSIAWHGRIVSVLFILFCSGGIILLAQRLITRRVDASLAVLKRVENGALDARIPVSAEDELGHLQHGINAMTATVGALLAEHRRSEEEMRLAAARLALVLSTTAEGILGLDTEGRVMFANPAAAGVLRWPSAEAMQGRSTAEVTGHRLTDGKPCDPAECRLCRADVLGQPHRVQDEFFTPQGGAPVAIEYVASPLVVSGTVTGAVVAFHDISDYKALEAELKNSNRQLEQFAYIASHDLREPLRMISSYIGLLERRYADRLDTDAREFIHFARDGAQRLDRMVLDLLEFSRIGRICDPFTPVSLAEVVGVALSDLAFKISEARATVTVAADLPVVTASRGELIRLIQNLVGNSVKYRAPDRPPEITIAATPAGADWIISVADNGIGIAPEFFDRIFEIFQRLHGRGEYDGTGIGLAICKKIVQHHGGRIWVESTPGVGTTMFFTLPGAA